MLAHVAARAVPGLERADAQGVERLTLCDGTAVLVRLDLGADHAVLSVVGTRPVRTSSTALPDGDLVRSARRWAGLDHDVTGAADVLAADALLAPLVATRPGLRVPGTLDPAELALRTVLGQQVSVAAARTLTARLVDAYGTSGPGGLRSFPTPGAVAAAGADRLRLLGLTGGRAATLEGLARALDDGLDLSPECDREEARTRLGAVRGIGPWTVEYIALRALSDQDAFPAHDLVLRAALGGPNAAEAARRAQVWRPWRGYAAQHLWASMAAGVVPAVPASRAGGAVSGVPGTVDVP